MLKKIALNVVLVAMCVGAGLWLGPLARAEYERLFPVPAYVSGNYDSLYRKAGKSVVMFSTSTCPHCKDARDLLRREHIDYQDFVINESPDARRQFEALDGSGVPLLFIGNRRILGFREEVIRDSVALIRTSQASRAQ